MNSQESNQTFSEERFKEVMKQVGQAQRHCELVSIRFTECGFAYDKVKGDPDSEVKLSITDQEIDLEPDNLNVSMKFEFNAPSPFEGDQDQQVSIFARIRLKYTVDRGEIELDPANAEAFGKVNGTYNAWPYLREYVQSCLSRLALPPFELPLLRVDTAAQLAGVDVSLPSHDS